MRKLKAGEMVKFTIGSVCVATGRISGYRNIHFKPNTPVPTYIIKLLDGGDVYIPEAELEKDTMSLKMTVVEWKE